ncbi:MAG: NAD(P)/FAD-dependent oxidoreductase [Phycisphaerae bacterium]|nr:NAD(P)/FAD-dependent oxidoreductase [Gemmatimonadaceae bacterium]
MDHSDAQRNDFDVIIVGGGAAGLSAALVLARLRVSVLVVDGGEPRNRFSYAMHGFLSRDGMHPQSFLTIGRQEVVAYGVRVQAGHATHMEGSLGNFALVLNGTRTTAARVVIATGLTDRLPELEGAAPLWGNRIVHCPFCHGWEVRDSHVGVIAWHPLSVHQAHLMRRLTNRLEVVPFGIDLDAAALSALAADQIVVRELEILRVAPAPDRGVMVFGADGSAHHYDALLMGGTPAANDQLLRQAGCALVDPPFPMGDGFVRVNAQGETSVPGLYAAGNVVDPTALVIAATAQGSAVGVAIVQAMVQETLQQ